MTRQTLLVPDAFTAEQRTEYDATAKMVGRIRDDGTFGGPFDPWLLNPTLARQLRELATLLWEGMSLDAPLVELAICITGRYWESNFEWAAHSHRALRSGVPQSVLDELLAGERPHGTPEQELLFDICTTMITTNKLPLPLYGEGVETFSERGLMEIVTIIGYYTMVSWTLNAFEVQLPPGMTAPFKREP